MELIWRKSSYSNNGGCIEVAAVDGCVLVRDTKDRSGPVLTFSSHEWNAFLNGIRNGDFDGSPSSPQRSEPLQL